MHGALTQKLREALRGECEEEVYKDYVTTVISIRELFREAVVQKVREELQFKAIKKIFDAEFLKTPGGRRIQELQSKLIVHDQEKLERVSQLASDANSIVEDLLPAQFKPILYIDTTLMMEQIVKEVQSQFNEKDYLKQLGFGEDDD